MSKSWFRQVENAQSESEVVAVARDYFAMWSPEEMGILPPAIRPPHLRDAVDLEELNRRAVEAFRETRASGEELELLQKLTGFVGRSCVRIAQLREREGGPTEAHRGDANRNPSKYGAARPR